jgi:hypothetical protein
LGVFDCAMTLPIASTGAIIGMSTSCVYRKPHPVERESESRKLIG